MEVEKRRSLFSGSGSLVAPWFHLTLKVAKSAEFGIFECCTFKGLFRKKSEQNYWWNFDEIINFNVVILIIFEENVTLFHFWVILPFLNSIWPNLVVLILMGLATLRCASSSRPWCVAFYWFDIYPFFLKNISH